jgi:hypothetical protein
MTVDRARPMAASGPGCAAGVACSMERAPAVVELVVRSRAPSRGSAPVAATGSAADSSSAASGMAVRSVAAASRWTGTGMICRWGLRWPPSSASSGACRRHQKRSTSLQAASRRCSAPATGWNSRAIGIAGTKARSDGRSMASPARPEVSAGCHSNRSVILPARACRSAHHPARGHSSVTDAASRSSATTIASQAIRRRTRSGRSPATQWRWPSRRP